MQLQQTRHIGPRTARPQTIGPNWANWSTTVHFFHKIRFQNKIPSIGLQKIQRPLWYHSRITLGSLWNNSENTLQQLRDHSGITQGSLRDHSGSLRDHSSRSIIQSFSGQFFSFQSALHHSTVLQESC